MLKLAADINLDNYESYLTVEQLKEVLYRIPQEYSKCKVMVERISDYYYENNNWETLKLQAVEYSEFIEEYTPVWCASFDKDNNILRLFMHY